MVHACTNNFSLISGEVSNYYINWSKASFDFSVADIQEQNNELHICWLCCKNTCKNLGWHTKEQAFVIWFWENPIVRTHYFFVNPCTKNCNFVHPMLAPLEEPKHSAPNLYASDLAPCQIVSMGIEYGSFITMGLGWLLFQALYYLSRFCPFWISLMVSIYAVAKAMHHIYIYIHVYIYIYL